MANFWPFRRKKDVEERSISSIDDYIAALNSFTYGGNQYFFGAGFNQPFMQTFPKGKLHEEIRPDLASYARNAYGANGIVYACMAVRQEVFSSIRFQFQRYSNGRPSEMFGTEALRILEEPWVGGTTQDMLSQMIQDADLVGNSYWVYHENELVRLRPDWVSIILEPRMVRGGIMGYRRTGYAYYEGGATAGNDPVMMMPDEVVHFAPKPDPMSSYRGMSWLTPVIREITNDGLMSNHNKRFFENAATPNLVVSLDKEITKEQFRQFVAEMNNTHRGTDNAGKTLYLGGGADVTVVGNSFEEMSFKDLQGHLETRIAAAAGTPPVIVGLSEGLRAATYSNYTQARRRFADGTMHPLWSNAAGSLRRIIPVPSATRLWYDARDVPFLREDRSDAANIFLTRASAMRQLIDVGFEDKSVVKATDAEDISLLKHTGLFSVQLWPPGSAPAQLAQQADETSTDEEESED